MKNNESVNDEIRIRIAYFRKKKGLTQNDVADAIGMARSTYSYYETKAVRFTPDFLGNVAKVLEISPNIFDVETNFDNSAKPIELKTNFSEDAPETFTPTSKEKNMIRLFRTLPEESKENIMKTLLNECKKFVDIDN